MIIDPVEETRSVLSRRLRAQGYAVEETSDPVAGADMALCSPPNAVVSELWMPGVSGLQLCRLLRSEPATAELVIVLSSDVDEPRNRFWADRAGANAYVPKRRTGELVRTLSKAIDNAKPADEFFMQLSGGTIDIRDRIARQLDAALFDSVIAAEVRALGTAGSFDRLFDLLVQFMSQVARYRWLAITTQDGRLALHHAVGDGDQALEEVRAVFGDTPPRSVLRVEDDDASAGPRTLPLMQPIPFGTDVLGSLAVSPCAGTVLDNLRALLQLVARELGGPVRMAALVEESERMASTDVLTGLMNRRSFTRIMNGELERANRYGHALSLALIDIDHFKTINDTHGHAAGDAVLAALGGLLGQGRLRSSDLAARWGGEEFVIAYVSTTVEGAHIAAERLRASIEALVVDFEGTKIPITASLGLTNLAPRESFAEFVDRADRAMYRSKTSGRNRVTIQNEPPPSISPHASPPPSVPGVERPRADH